MEMRREGGDQGMETKLHKHPLFLNEKVETDKFVCDVCGGDIVGSAYDCKQRECDFSIHKSCSNLPQEIQHPFHPQHTLTFLSPPPDDHDDDDSDSKKLTCSACGMTGWEFIYHCSDCQFYLDVPCSALTPTKDYPDQSNQLQLLKHPHPLIICNHINDKYSPVSCSACDLQLDNMICVCLECKCLLHQSCTNFPEEIKHSFHPLHPLTLLHRAPYISGRFGCDACRRGSVGFTYNCSQCRFDLDVHCASLMPITEDQIQEQHQTKHLRHPHPLFICTKKTGFPYPCNACYLPLEDSIYVCLPCKNLLHKSCSELPVQIEHPFHRLHPLTLRKTSKRISCRACRKFTRGFAYGCWSCRFLVHTRCCWPIPPSIRSEYHNHRLSILNIEAERLFCNSCKKHCNSAFFSCVECNFNLHVHCYPKLPPTIKHKSHLHPLTFTNSPDHEDDHEEFSCNICGGKRDLSDPTYYCAECHYSAHVHCVLSEVPDASSAHQPQLSADPDLDDRLSSPSQTPPTSPHKEPPTKKIKRQPAHNNHPTLRVGMKVNLFSFKIPKEVVAKGSIVSLEPSKEVEGVPLGPHFCEVNIEEVAKPRYRLIRPLDNVGMLQEAVGENIA